MKRSKEIVVQKIVITALFAALCSVATFIQVPLPFGYFNLGDIFVLMSAWVLGPIGAIAAALGSAITDMLLGYAIYAPATFVIKGGVAIVAYFAHKLFSSIIKKDRLDVIRRATSAILGECVMVGGYFFYESMILGYGMGALASVWGNTLQALAGVFGATLLMSVLPKRIFERLK